MAIAFVQSIGYSVSSSNGTTASLTSVAAGSLLVTTNAAFVAGNPANVTPSDDQANTWNTTTAPTPRDATNCFINYAMNAAAATTVVTIDYGSNFAADGEFAEFSGIATASALDTQGTGGSASDSTPDVTASTGTAQNDELVVACMSTGNAGNPAGIDTPATTGYTNLHVQNNNVNNVGSASDYKIVSATETSSAAWGTLAAASSWSSKIATFKSAAVGGGGGSTRRRFLPALGVA